MTRAAALPAALLLAVGCAAAPPAEESPAPADPAPAPDESAQAGPDYVTQGPQPIADAASVGIGKPVADFAYRDVRGRSTGTLSSLLAAEKPVVVLFTTLKCPVTRRYAPLLEERAQAWVAKGAVVLCVNPSIVDEDEDVAAGSESHGWSFPVTRDPDYAIMDALGAQRTADTFVIDPSGTLRYRGPIDDQIGINYLLEKPRRLLLDDALDSVLKGDDVAQPAMNAPG